MAAADVVITGTVLTVDEARPTAEALALADGRIIAVGDRSAIAGFIGPDTQTIDIGDGCVMPGFIEAHGHPLMEAVALSDRIVDIRPVTVAKPDDVLAAVRHEVAVRGQAGAYLNGWDALLQSGLPDPNLAWLDDIAPDSPLVIIHNSGHKAFFNSHAARLNGLTRDTADPKGAKYGRNANGELDGTAEEIAAVFPLLGGAIAPDEYPAMLRAECARLNRAGLTTCSEMAFDPNFGPVLAALHDDLTVRLRTYDRVVVSVSGYRSHPHHRGDAGFLRLRQLHLRTADRDRRRLLSAGLANGVSRAGRRRGRHHPRRVRASTAT
jgi:predicted amidohydrolase YtcJ